MTEANITEHHILDLVAKDQGERDHLRAMFPSGSADVTPTVLTFIAILIAIAYWRHEGAAVIAVLIGLYAGRIGWRARRREDYTTGYERGRTVGLIKGLGMSAEQFHAACNAEAARIAETIGLTEEAATSMSPLVAPFLRACARNPLVKSSQVFSTTYETVS